MRTELDDDDAAVLVRQIRREVRREVERIKAEEGVDLEKDLWLRNGVTRAVEDGGARRDGGSGGNRGAVVGRDKL
jgi:hypothetical protein